jgi:NAD(P)-dependent dehydrogenase (short-subunit alcohol dehydrogenase family)
MTHGGRLAGKTALITGGTTGIGFATARRFLAEGARVAITGQDEARVARAGRALGAGVLALRSDAGVEAALEPLAQRIEAAFGTLDVLFLNAGIAPYGDLAAADADAFDRTFAVNVKGPLLAARRLVPIINRGGSIIFTTSMNSRIGMAKTHIYAASKAAAGSLVRTLAGELAPRGIRVNALSPGPVITEIGATTGMNEAEGLEVAATVLAKVPMHRFAEADELAAAALFLACADASFITGQEIVADGGWTGVGG